jgi:PAS domain S-box-containing protein
MISNLGMVFLLGSLAFSLAYGVILLLAVERVQRKKCQTLGELSEKLFHLNRLLIDTNQQLQQSEELFRTSVEIMPDSFGIYSAIRDQSGQIIDFCVEYINDAACLNNHMTREEQLGKRLCEILPGHRESSLFAEYCQVVETGQPLVKDELIYEDDYGSQHLIRAFDIRVAKFKDGFVATWGDVTARCQLEEEYRQQKQELQALVENSPDIITRFDHELRYTYANLAHEKTTGLKSEALIGKNLAEIWATSEAQYPQWQATLQAAFQTGQIQIDEFSFLAADSTTHFYQIQVVPELIKDGSVGSVLTVSRELTKRKQAEEALRQKQEWLTLVQAAAKIGSFEWNIQTNINTWSNDLEAIYGLEPGEFGGSYQEWARWVHPEDLPKAENDVRRSLETGELFTDWRVIWKDGSVHWLHARARVFFDNDGNPLRMVGINVDITDRKQTEIALSQANERFHLAAAAVDCLIYEWTVEKNQVERTQGLFRLLGYSVQEAEPTIEWWREKIHPDDIPHLPKTFAQVSSVDGRCSCEYRVRHKQGHYIYVLDQCIILSDKAGKPVRVVGSTMDITERKLAEAQNQQLASLVENSTDFISVATVEGQPRFLNAAGKQLVGLTEETFCQVNHISKFFAAKDLAYFQQTILPTLKELGNWHGEFRLQNFVTKTSVPVFSNIFTIKDKKTGQPVALAMVSRDISAQKQIEDERAQLLVREQVARQQAESASRMKDEFLAIVSHELRSPLNGILGWSRLLRTRKLAPDKTEQALVSIERNAQVQTQLIEDLLDISRIIQGKVRLNLCPTSLVSAIQAALDTVTPTASTKSIHIESRLDPQANLVSGDADRLQQIFWNLLSNAVKFTPVGGRVEIRLEKVDNCAQIQVIDTGKGIRADFLPYIFQRFSQADATTTRTQGGLGLGLAIVRNLVELHGGTVSVTSLGEGKGATFTVQLPLLLSNLRHTQEELTIQRQTDWKTNFDLSGLKILAVDDEADAREFLKTALEQYGAVTVTAASSREAIQLMQSAKPDVLLSDIGMPGEDGYTLIRRIRQLPPEQGGQIPAAALTAYARQDDRLHALAAGFQMHVSKPIEPIQLLTVVTRLAGRVQS